MIRVSAGIIYSPEGKILVCRRGEGRKNAHLWEFPGGKQEEGENPEDCLIRELREELHLEVRDVKQVYTDNAQGLAFDFLTARAMGEPVLTEHEALQWAEPAQLAELDFCPADREVAAAICLKAARLKYFFWDLDGTLMDTYPAMIHCFREALAHYGATLPEEEVLDWMKHSLWHCALWAEERFGIPADDLIAVFRKLDDAYPPERILPVAGIPATLQALQDRGAQHYIVTHRNKTAWTYLQANGLRGFFRDGVTKESRFPRKPDPASILHLLQKHGLDPACSIMIGDRPLDTKAGWAAGMYTCLLDTEDRFPDEPCTLRVATAKGLERLLMPDWLPDV